MEKMHNTAPMEGQSCLQSTINIFEICCLSSKCT